MSRPVVLTLFLTHQCNLRCSYCYVHEKRAATMPIEVGRKAIDLALQIAKDKLQISFFGGEPLLEWDLLSALHQYGKQRTAERGVAPIFAVTTNGMFLDDDRLAYLRDNDIRVGFSIDGNRQAQDATRPKAGGGSSHERTVERLRLTLKHMPDVQTISVIDPANVAHLADSVRELLDIGVKRVTLNPNWSADWSDETTREVWQHQYEEISKIYVDRFRGNAPVRISFIEDKIITRLKSGYAPCDQCDFGNRDFAVSTTGKVYPCERQVGSDGEAEEHMVIGTVDEGFDKRRQRNLLRGIKDVPDECRRCALADRCANWCPCANLALTGELGRPGGLLCFHEQLTVKWADESAAVLYAEKNLPFMARFYS
jgi:uncharacterized protein